MRGQHNGQNGKLFADLQNTNAINYHFMRPPVHGQSRPSAVDSPGYSPVRGSGTVSGRGASASAVHPGDPGCGDCCSHDLRYNSLLVLLHLKKKTISVFITLR